MVEYIKNENEKTKKIAEFNKKIEAVRRARDFGSYTPGYAKDTIKKLNAKKN